jgi:hypothetical protein
MTLFSVGRNRRSVAAAAAVPDDSIDYASSSDVLFL